MIRCLLIGLLAIFCAAWLDAAKTSAVEATIPQGSATEIIGDTDCSGLVDETDALTILAFVADVPFSAGCLDARADVNCDNFADVFDALGILLHASGNSVQPVEDCAAIGGEFTGGEIPSSADLIEAALVASVIDDQTAIVYKLFAAFGDERLPAEYKGTDEAVPLSFAVADAALAYDSLSAANRALVDPFLLPPGDEDSWYGEKHLLAPGLAQPAAALTMFHPGYSRTVRVMDSLGFPQDVPVRILTALTLQPSTSEVMANLVEAFLPVAVDVYGRLPRLLAGTPLDIYVMPDLAVNSTFGWVEPNTSCDYEPVWLAVDSDILTAAQPQMFPGGAAGQQMQAMMHALGLPEVMNFEMQFCIFETHLGNSQRFLLEMFQGFSEHAARPLLNSEHVWKDAFRFPTQGMLTPKFGYSYWPILARISQEHPGATRSIWAATETNNSALKALNSGVPGGFFPYFRGFGKSIWNRPPVATLQTFDSIQDKVRQLGTTGGLGGFPQLIRLEGEKTFKYRSLDPLMSPFSSRHYHFVLTDPNVKSIQVNNLLHGRERAGLEVMWKIEGSDAEWQEEDWTEETSQSFCFENADERVVEIVLIYTLGDHNFLNPLPLPNVPVLEARDTCGWTGDATVTLLNDTTGIDTFVTGTATGLLFVEGEPAAEPASAGTTYELAGGTLTWTYRPESYIEFGSGGAQYHCTRTMAPLTVELGEGDAEMVVEPTTEGSFNFTLLGVRPGQLTGRHECEAGGFSYDIGVDLGFPWLCGEGTVGPETTEVEGEEHYGTSQDPPPPAECPVVGQSGGNTYPQDFVALNVDWEFHLER